MREIRFRGKRKDNKKISGCVFDNNWAYGYYFHRQSDDKHFISFNHIGHLGKSITISVEVIPETVGQYTGREDICEGDYIVMDCWNGGDGTIEPDEHDIFEGVVVYDKNGCAFGIQTKSCVEGEAEVGLLKEDNYTKIEVIGNIHENPELLKGD